MTAKSTKTKFKGNTGESVTVYSDDNKIETKEGR